MYVNCGATVVTQNNSICLSNKKMLISDTELFVVKLEVVVWLGRKQQLKDIMIISTYTLLYYTYFYKSIAIYASFTIYKYNARLRPLILSRILFH